MMRLLASDYCRLWMVGNSAAGVNYQLTGGPSNARRCRGRVDSLQNKNPRGVGQASVDK